MPRGRPPPSMVPGGAAPAGMYPAQPPKGMHPVQMQVQMQMPPQGFAQPQWPGMQLQPQPQAQMHYDQSGMAYPGPMHGYGMVPMQGAPFVQAELGPAAPPQYGVQGQMQGQAQMQGMPTHGQAPPGRGGSFFAGMRPPPAQPHVVMQGQPGVPVQQFQQQPGIVQQQAPQTYNQFQVLQQGYY